MSRMYWKSNMLASTSSDDLSFTPGTTGGIVSTNAGAAIREIASNKTGVIMSKELAVGTTSFTFTNSYFTDNMYVDYYCNKDIKLKGVPTYSTGTLTFTCSATEVACTFRIVVKF